MTGLALSPLAPQKQGCARLIATYGTWTEKAAPEADALRSASATPQTNRLL
jgi:hypothetical protein